VNRTTWLLILQGLGITLQGINAGIGTITHNAVVVLVVASVVGGYQYVLQNLGNNATPPGKS
jgi:hypothetical protein